MALLLPCLKPNAFGVLESELYRSARAGTKHVIEELVDELEASLGISPISPIYLPYPNP